MDSTIFERTIVRRATEKDISSIAEINAAAFTGNKDDISVATRWVECWLRAFPLYQYFVAEVDGKVLGYIGWQVHGGFLRPEPVVELEQTAIAEDARGQKLGPKLDEESLRLIVEWMRENNPRIKNELVVVVWAYATNTRALTSYSGLFEDGMLGLRTQYDGKPEAMLRRRIPMREWLA